jgi:lysophospholipase L1-like esterase
MHDEYLPANAAVLEQLLMLLHGRGVEVVMLTTPVWPTYQAGIHQGAWLRAKAIIEVLANKYGVRYLNFQHEPRMKADDFEDSDHLNAEGAVHFAKLLEATIGPVRVESDQSGGGRG